MQINIEQISLDAGRSFRAYDYNFLSQDQAFHAHEEYELALVEGMDGFLYCGAETLEFSSGDLFVFGRRLPHRFIAAPDTSGNTGSEADDECHNSEIMARVIQFRHDAFGSGFFYLPENAAIGKFLRSADSGMAFRAFGGKALAAIISATRARRLAGLLTLLEDLAGMHEGGHVEILARGSASLGRGGLDAERISRLQDYIESEYAAEASVDGAAGHLALTRTSFCRYVKRCTGRTFTELLNDYRLTVAAMLLRNPSSTVSGVSQDVGFGSLSHFNARFRERFRMTPSEFRTASFGNRVPTA